MEELTGGELIQKLYEVVASGKEIVMGINDVILTGKLKNYVLEDCGNKFFINDASIIIREDCNYLFTSERIGILGKPNIYVEKITPSGGDMDPAGPGRRGLKCGDRLQVTQNLR